MKLTYQVYLILPYGNDHGASHELVHKVNLSSPNAFSKAMVDYFTSEMESGVFMISRVHPESGLPRTHMVGCSAGGTEFFFVSHRILRPDEIAPKGVVCQIIP